MNLLRDNIVPALIGSILSGLGALALSIYTDFLPTLVPALRGVAPETYAKILLLLMLLLLLVTAVAIAIFIRARPYRPRALSGKTFGFHWSAALDYSKKRNNEVEIEIQWLCPKHKVYMGTITANIPETTYHNLWCAKCNETYAMKSQGDTVFVEEAERIIERQLLGKLRLE